MLNASPVLRAFGDPVPNGRAAEIVREKIESEPLAQIDYIAVVDNETLEPIEKVRENAVLIAVAVRFGKVRLIDNIVLNRKQ